MNQQDQAVAKQLLTIIVSEVAYGHKNQDSEGYYTVRLHKSVISRAARLITQWSEEEMAQATTKRKRSGKSKTKNKTEVVTPDVRPGSSMRPSITTEHKVQRQED